MKKFALMLLGSLCVGVGCISTDWKQTVSNQTVVERSNQDNVGVDAGDTPLILACKTDNVKKVRELLATGIDVNAANAKGNTPLMAASEAGHADIIKVLGENKQLDLEAMNWNMDTALMLAVRNQQVAAVKALIALGANVNFIKAGMSVLIAASYRGNAEIVKALLEGGADTVWADENGDTALDVAIATNQPQIAALLQQYSRR